MRYTLLKFLRDQLSKPPPLLTNSYNLNNKTIVVTGANTGLGFEAAKHFARMKPGKVVLACRNMEKAERAAESIRTETRFAGVEVRLLDQADFASVKSFANKFSEEEERLDVLVANAGVARDVYEGTKDGWETTLQTNHLSPALLSLLLLPKILSTAQRQSPGSTGKPRISIVSSETHYFGKFTERALQSENLLKTLGSEEYCQRQPLAMHARYTETKLLNIFFTRALAEHVSSLSSASSPSPQVIVTAVNPGLCVSSIHTRISNPVISRMNRLMEPLLARSTEVGGRALVWGALGSANTSSELRGDKEVYGELGDETHGQYINGWNVEEVSDYVVRNRELERRIWRETVNLLSRVEPSLEGMYLGDQ